MKVHGRCHCGEITYEAEVEAGTVNVCHCRDCQMLSGTAMTHIAVQEELNGKVVDWLERVTDDQYNATREE